jgi:aspartate/methionine/tyrosine aminotransferase
MKNSDPILECALRNMPEGFSKVINKEDFIVKVSARAAQIKKAEPDFARSDIGQCIGVMPDLEVYYGPPVGRISLRKLVAEFWTRYYGLDDLTYENVAVTVGATHALSLLFAMLAHDQKVILSVPHWPTIPDTIMRAGAKPIGFELIDEDGNLRLKELDELIGKENAKILALNFPNNPSGITASEQQLADIAELARKHDLVIVSDEVYNRIRFSGKPTTMLSFAPERTVAVSGASKEYLIPGQRVGFVISKCKKLTDLFLNKIIRCDCSCPSVVGQDVMIPIITKEVEELKQGKEPSFLIPVIKELKARRDALAECLVSAGFKLMADRPSDGSIFMLAKLPPQVKLSDPEFVDKAMEMKKISGIPGSGCGKPGWVRFSFGSMTMEDIARFGKNLKTVIDTLTSK